MLYVIDADGNLIATLHMPTEADALRSDVVTVEPPELWCDEAARWNGKRWTVRNVMPAMRPGEGRPERIKQPRVPKVKP